jgi:hypothetical protein
MAKNQAAVELGKLGGKAKAAKHGVEQVRQLGLANRKPDNQVSKHALYMREYRKNKGLR